MTQDAAIKPKPAVSAAAPEKKKQIDTQAVAESLKNIADDIGQISELSSEEKLLVAQFFSSLLKLMQPLASSIAVSQDALPVQVGDVTQAHVDPTGHLVLQFTDGHVELKNLSEDKYRDLMMAVVGDVVPKFKSLTSMQKRKLENRIKMLSSITKEIQKSSEALSAALSAGQ